MTDDDAMARPVEYLQAGIGGPAAGILADLGSVAGDLAYARDAARKYAAMATEAREMTDRVVGQALWSAAAISYRRAFGSGKSLLVAGTSRARLVPEAIATLPELSPEQREAHTLTLLLANQHIAHRVGEQEDARVIAFLAPPPQARRVEGVGLVAIRMFGPEPDVAIRLAEVCELLLAGVESHVSERRERLLADLLADPNVDRFYAAAEPR